MADGKTLNGKFSAACPLCGDPGIYALWVGDEPPVGCGQPFDAKGKPIDVKSVTDCYYAMGKAKQRALMIQLKPDCFNEDGSMKEGRLAEVLLALPDGTKLFI